MKTFRALASCVLGLSLAPSAMALTYGEAKSLAKSLPMEYLDTTDHGKLCEVLGVKILQDANPGLQVLNGVVYKKKGRVVGELDLVMLKDNVVTDVIEVKCMSAYGKAANKAEEQLDRFSAYIGRCDVDFSVEGNAVPCDVFGNPDIRLGKMSYTDAKSAGFNFDLDFSRKELLQLIKDARATYNVKEPLPAALVPVVAEESVTIER